PRRAQRQAGQAGPQMTASGDMWLGPALQEAWAHHNAGRLAEAEVIYRRMLARKTDFAPAPHPLGLLAHQTGHNDDGLNLITRAVALDPRDAASQNDLGLVLIARGNAREAATAFRAAIAVDPGIADVYCNLATILTQLGEPDEAARSVRRALELAPDIA